MSSSSPAWRDRFGLGLRLGFLFLLCGVAVGLVLFDRGTYHRSTDVTVMLGPVGSATLLFCVAGTARPGLLGGDGVVRFPLNLTLPLVYTVLTRLSVLLWASPEQSAFRPVDPLIPALFWAQPMALAAMCALQVAVLSAWLAYRRSAATEDSAA